MTSAACRYRAGWAWACAALALGMGWTQVPGKRWRLPAPRTVTRRHQVPQKVWYDAIAAAGAGSA